MKYRPDLDGLRAIAVMVVILYHYGVPGFSGGYAGVDIFFVLSGYLIGSIVFSELRSGSFSFTDFYLRRIKRLFPAYTLVMVVTSIFAYWLMLPADFREFGQSLLAATLYLSNILFYMEAGYFDTASHLKPLLHTWSLAVEEQFYLVFPLVAWLLARGRQSLVFWFFCFASLISLAASVWYLHRDASAVFYLFPFRAWELGLGILLAIGHIPALRSDWARNAISIIGLCAIVFPVALYDHSTAFPGMAALVPCLGTAALIYIGREHRGSLSQLLSTKLPVFIGKISYSLYLWHWPVVVFYEYGQAGEKSFFDVVPLLAITFVCSLLSYYFVEVPVRRGQWRMFASAKPAFISAGMISLAFVLAGYTLHLTNGLPQRLEPKVQAFAQAAGDLFGDISDCPAENNSVLPGIGHCLIGDPLQAEAYTLVWGDSHSAAYLRGLEATSRKHDRAVLVAWSGGCPPLLGVSKDETVSSQVVDELCYERNQAVSELINTDRRIESVVLVGRWSYYVKAGGTGVDQHNRIAIWPHNGERISVKNQEAYFLKSLEQTLDFLQQRDVRIFVVEQAPEFPQFVARDVVLDHMYGRDRISETGNTLTSEKYDQVLARQGEVQKFLNQIEAKEIAKVLRTHHFFCDQHFCSLMLEGVPAYFDNNHISSAGAYSIRAMFDPLFE